MAVCCHMNVDFKKVPSIIVFNFYSKCHTSCVLFLSHILKFMYIYFVPQFDLHKHIFLECVNQNSFSYLQIDAMLKQLHINGDSECSGLLLCNHLNFHYTIGQHLVSFLGTFQKVILRGV